MTTEAKTSIPILIPGLRLPVIVSNAKMLVRDIGMRFVLLGRDLVDLLVFNLTKYISDN